MQFVEAAANDVNLIQNPKWQPKDLEGVNPADVDSCFGALDSSSDELAV